MAFPYLDSLRTEWEVCCCPSAAWALVGLSRLRRRDRFWFDRPRRCDLDFDGQRHRLGQGFQGWLTERPIKPELGLVEFDYLSQVLHPRLVERLLSQEQLDGFELANAEADLACPFQHASPGLFRLAHRFLGAGQGALAGTHDLGCGGHVSGDLGLHLRETEIRLVVLRTACLSVS